jgi:hypothetical protein
MSEKINLANQLRLALAICVGLAEELTDDGDEFDRAIQYGFEEAAIGSDDENLNIPGPDSMFETLKSRVEDYIKFLETGVAMPDDNLGRE